MPSVNEIIYQSPSYAAFLPQIASPSYDLALSSEQH